jgi:hypothetical protein
LLLLAGSVVFSLWENSFLFNIDRVHAGMSNGETEALLGTPYSRSHVAQGADEANRIEELWVYKIQFCGVFLGTWQLDFQESKLLSKSVYVPLAASYQQLVAAFGKFQEERQHEQMDQMVSHKQ